MLGVVASVLAIFTWMTQMHERYAYGALIFLLLLIPERRFIWLAIAFGVVFTLNVWTAAPPAPVFREWLPNPGWPALAGSVAMIVITGLTLLWMASERVDDRSERDHRVGEASGTAGL